MAWRTRNGKSTRYRAKALISLAAMAGGVALSLLAGSALAVPLYSVTDLGDLGGGTSTAWGINDAGQVVGHSNTGSANHAFLWSSGTGMQDLGDLPGRDDDSQAFDINNAGQVVGRSSGTDGERAFRWSSGSGMQDLGTFPGGDFALAKAIDDDGNTVGWGTLPGLYHGFLHSDSNGIQDLGDLPGGLNDSAARDINDAGQVVGGSSSTSGTHAFLWTATEGIQDLGDLPGGSSFSTATAINDAGQVVGISSTATGSRAFLWIDGLGMQDLGVLFGGNFSQATDINNSGQVIGISSGAGNLPFLWEPVSGMRDLNTLLDSSGIGWHLSQAHAINSAGQIAGYGLNPQGALHAFLLTPISQQTTGIPEPSTILLIGSGCLALALGGRHFSRSVRRTAAAGSTRRGTVPGSF